MHSIKLALAAIIGAVSAWMGSVWPLIALVIAAILFDYITGFLAGRATTGINSRTAAKGLYKKVGFLCLLCLGFLLDVALSYFIEQGVGITLPFNTPFGLIVAAWIVITEAISITENLAKLGVPLPDWLLKFLKATHKSLGEGEGK